MTSEETVMMGYGWGMGTVGWIFMALFWIVLIGLVVWAVVALLPGNRTGSAVRPESPGEILDRRFARGEIDVEQYRLARAELAENQPARR
jgi:putative membrane protein